MKRPDHLCNQLFRRGTEVWPVKCKLVRRKETWNQMHFRNLIDTGEYREMNIQQVKKYAFALALALGFVVAPGLSSLSTVQAQDWRYYRDRRDNRRPQRDDRRIRRDDRWDNRRNDRWDDRWDNRNGYNQEEQKGFRDGLRRGQEDLRDRRRFDPNNSSHYRKGNSSYREGFRRGYVQGYRQYNDRRW
jgi:hypothetical protein